MAREKQIEKKVHQEGYKSEILTNGGGELLLLAYFPISFYCDWKEKQGKWDEVRVRTLRIIRDYMMTSILFPITLYSDLTFWILWMKDPALIAPVAIFKYLPTWSQHSLHTISAIKVVLDILLLPRKRPAKWLPNFALMLGFPIIYLSVITMSHWNGETVYALQTVMNRFQIAMFIIFSFTQLIFFYTVQWHIVDFIWKTKPRENGVCNGVGNYNVKSHSN